MPTCTAIPNSYGKQRVVSRPAAGTRQPGCQHQWSHLQQQRFGRRYACYDAQRSVKLAAIVYCVVMRANQDVRSGWICWDGMVRWTVQWTPVVQCRASWHNKAATL